MGKGMNLRNGPSELFHFDESFHKRSISFNESIISIKQKKLILALYIFRNMEELQIQLCGNTPRIYNRCKVIFFVLYFMVQTFLIVQDVL